MARLIVIGENDEERNAYEVECRNCNREIEWRGQSLA